MTVIFLEFLAEHAGVSHVWCGCLRLLYLSKYVLFLLFSLNAFDFLINCSFSLSDHLLTVIIIQSGDAAQVYHWQCLKHVWICDKLPFFKEHAWFVRRTEGKSEGLALTWLEDAMRVVTVEPLHTI